MCRVCVYVVFVLCLCVCVVCVVVLCVFCSVVVLRSRARSWLGAGPMSLRDKIVILKLDGVICTSCVPISNIVPNRGNHHVMPLSPKNV